MNDFSKNIIPHNASVIEAMKKLNEVPGSLTLFAVNKHEQLVGTITDGDIRRGFIHGLTLNDSVEKFMLKSFHRWRTFVMCASAHRLK